MATRPSALARRGLGKKRRWSRSTGTGETLTNSTRLSCCSRQRKGAQIKRRVKRRVKESLIPCRSIDPFYRIPSSFAFFEGFEESHLKLAGHFHCPKVSSGLLVQQFKFHRLLRRAEDNPATDAN